MKSQRDTKAVGVEIVGFHRSRSLDDLAGSPGKLRVSRSTDMLRSESPVEKDESSTSLAPEDVQLKLGENGDEVDEPSSYEVHLLNMARKKKWNRRLVRGFFM